MTGPTPSAGSRRKTKSGRVVSDKMDKTIVVSVERLARHRLYKRVIRLTTRFKAHDEANEARIGDTVLIEEARPLSATKRWRLIQVVQRAGEDVRPADIVTEEAATSEAIHAAAHPGRRAAGESVESGESDTASGATDVQSGAAADVGEAGASADEEAS
jgi:small subunit ribosomal protein S17